MAAMPFGERQAVSGIIDAVSFRDLTVIGDCFGEDGNGYLSASIKVV